MVNWDNIHIRTGLLTGDIYIGKIKDDNGLDVFIDKSKPVTNECVKAVMEHMLYKCEECNGKEVSFKIDGICELTIKDLRNK